RRLSPHASRSPHVRTRPADRRLRQQHQAGIRRRLAAGLRAGCRAGAARGRGHDRRLRRHHGGLLAWGARGRWARRGRDRRAVRGARPGQPLGQGAHPHARPARAPARHRRPGGWVHRRPREHRYADRAVPHLDAAQRQGPARGIRAWDESWMAVPAEVAGLAERILGAEAGSVSLHANVTLAQASALSGVDFTPPRNRLVCTAEDFPSVLYLYEGLARRGVEVARVPVRSGHEVEEDDVLAAIDERTAIVAISHVLFRTSRVLDLQPIVRRAHAAGARVMIDAYQAVGTVPLNVAALDIDLLAGGSVKWLCGGPGAGYLYARPRARATLEPAFT